jgi:hypothetical protein
VTIDLANLSTPALELLARSVERTLRADLGQPQATRREISEVVGLVLAEIDSRGESPGSD